jgi:RNA polymerase sigma-70 factor (ECF subfamily)
MNKNILDLRNMSDAEILAVSVERPAAFEVIVSRYQEAFLRKVSAMLRDKETAKDLVQDTFVKIYRHAGKFAAREDATFKSWAYSILLNTCYSYFRKRKRDREFLNVLDQEALDLLGAYPDTDRRQYLDRFTSIVARIPAAFAEILVLSVVDGKSRQEIADLEGISVGSVRTRLSRAKAQFKKIASRYE